MTALFPSLATGLAKTLSRRSVVLLSVFLGACGGGGGGGGSASGLVAEGNPSEAVAIEQVVLSYEEDIRPILNARCVGCHNSGENPLAPFSLEGAKQANTFKSAISFAIEAQTMPPAGALQLTSSERGKLLAWASGQAYAGDIDVQRIALVEAKAWDVQPRNRDLLIDHRPETVDCPRDIGWLAEDDTLEIRTEFCNYAGLTQQALLELDAGTELELVFSHSQLTFNAPATAHIAISIGGNPIWDVNIDIPAAKALYKETLTLPFAVGKGDAIDVHLHNHGDNAWTLHSLVALVPGDRELEFCPTFDSTFAAIQATVFEQAGCANSLCHGAAVEGGLDLRPAVAFENLVGVQSQSSSLMLVDPRKPAQSYLYHKLSAKTFPGSYAIDGSPMPSAGQGISPGQLEAIRLWIEAGAPGEGSVGDTLGRGEDELERLLGVCLPEAEAVNTTPLPAPQPDRGVQFKMPPHEVAAESEREICFAVYEDFRDQIPEEYMTPDREFFFVESNAVREDAFTHHNILFHSPVPVELIHAPEFGGWSCVEGPRAGEACEPTDSASCGDAGQCRAGIETKIACRGYGPRVLVDNPNPGSNQEEVFGNITTIGTDDFTGDGFYQAIPTHGLFYWNSHAFNLTTEDGLHHVWRNFYLADDRRFQAEPIAYVSNIYAATGTPPFEKQTVCRDYVMDQGDGLLSMSSHTHKRGERFFVSLKGGAEIYETFTYDEPLQKNYDPVIVFNDSDPQARTLEYCATFNNGVNADGSPNIETVTRLSRRPDSASACEPLACVAGKVGAPCAGADDDAACDSSPGAGDGWCDACPITTGASSDDEMFVLLLTRLANHDALVKMHGETRPRVRIVEPTGGAAFAPGDIVQLQLQFENFDLVPPEDHDHDGEAGSAGHHGAGGNHGHVSAGHYHVYLDSNDDTADHLTAWTSNVEMQLPADISAGTYVIRVSLRAPDHHALGVEELITIEVTLNEAP